MRSSLLESFLVRNERSLILLFCLLAGIRVFVFTAAFPFFSNIDESDHFDVISKYAHGEIPEAGELFGDESSALIGRFASPEYYHYESQYKDGNIPLPWWSDSSQIPDRMMITRIMRNQISGEAMQPPVYYFVTGCWHRLGKVIGLRGGFLLYWTRFLNVPAYVLMVGLAYATVRKFYPDRLFLRIGVPMMLVFFPQDVFYQLSNDVFSALLCGVVFYLALDFYVADSISYKSCLLTGLAVAVACLVKLTNMLVMPMLAVVVLAKARILFSNRRLGGEWPKMAALLAAGLLPVAAWMLQNHSMQGGWTNSTFKMSFLRLRPCSWDEILHHPIFTLHGAAFFWDELLRTFWRGETGWMLLTLSWDVADVFYSSTSFLFLMAALLGLVIGWRKKSDGERFSTSMMFLAFATGIGLIAWLSVSMISVPFEGHGFLPHPSPEHPYVTAGRLISGALIPFLILYLQGLDWLLSRWKGIGVRLACVGAILLLMAGSEIVISQGPFHSRYNWFHLP